LKVKIPGCLLRMDLAFSKSLVEQMWPIWICLTKKYSTRNFSLRQDFMKSWIRIRFGKELIDYRTKKELGLWYACCATVHVCCCYLYIKWRHIENKTTWRQKSIVEHFLLPLTRKVEKTSTNSTSNASKSYS